MAYKIFISYSKFDKEIAGNIKDYFEEYKNINCFLAHDDLEPSSVWEKEIIKNLDSTNVFMPLQTKHLEESYWCQQEAGYALAKEIRIIPLMLDTNYNLPIGFYAKFQGHTLKVNDLRISIKKLLIKEKIIRQDNSEEIEKRIYVFSKSNSWEEASNAIQSLLEFEDGLINADVIRIIDIAADNSEIRNSFDARKFLRNFISKHANIISAEKIKIFI
ncbi:MAG: toll/interleukin-1 receptor domain-containing protein [Cyanobacteria bacterium]|nr:toll/interleukin-1 receptor domain-containing protein [Cyanobacteriota bacterium]